MSTETKIRGSMLRENLIGSQIAVLAPGFHGTVTRFEPGLVGGRAWGDSLPFEAAATNANAFVVSQLNVSLETAPAATQESGRSGAVVSPRLIVPKRGDADYAVLQTAPNGESRWLLPSGPAGDEVVFELAPTQPPPPQNARGTVTLTMRGIVRVVTWVAAPVLGQAALAAARNWENLRRPYGLHQVTLDGGLANIDWPSLASGPLLLLVHGTFSSPTAAFHGWVGGDAFRAVAEHYEGRCLALAHPTLSAGPDDNIDWILSQLPVPRLEPMDIVCHSRGGLVARAIAANDRFDVRRVCQVGAPNHGTRLAQAENILSFLDGHTAFLTSLPDAVSTILLEGILSALKLVATGAVGGLPGLAAMTPNGDYLKALGDRKLGSQRWFTIGADFRPAASRASGFAPRMADTIADGFFGTENDLVVPSDGCHLPGPTPVDSLRLSGADVHHTNYFRSAAVHDKLTEWLR